ncbi:MAG: EamA family transporter, partial [Ramlibacter sp.]|nr:EamA family transporter [Ramlibacter sp.]
MSLGGDKGTGGMGAAWVRVMPGVFVVIWSTGFIVARYGMPHAPPLKFLALRFGLSVACFGIWAALSRASWPTSASQWRHLAVTGLLMHAGYLGGVWNAVKLGMGAGLVALLVGLQPVLT